MLRSFINTATRWVAVGVIAIFAIGGFPGIAAACEGGGAEIDVEGVFEKEEEALVTKMEAANPFELLAEVSEEPVAHPGKGAITNVGTCKKGAHFKGGASCKYEQNDPIGSLVEFAEL